METQGRVTERIQFKTSEGFKDWLKKRAESIPDNYRERYKDSESEVSPLNIEKEKTLEIKAEMKPKTFNDKKGTFEATFVTSQSVYRETWYGYRYEEVQRVTEEAIDMDRFEKGILKCLIDHDYRVENVLGVVDKLEVKGKKLKGRIKIKENLSEKLQLIKNDIKEGDLNTLSIGYSIKEIVVTEREDNIDLIEISKWELLEVSVVAVPADKNAIIKSNPKSSFEVDNSEKKKEASSQESEKPLNKKEELEKLINKSGGLAMINYLVSKGFDRSKLELLSHEALEAKYLEAKEEEIKEEVEAKAKADSNKAEEARKEEEKAEQSRIDKLQGAQKFLSKHGFNPLDEKGKHYKALSEIKDIIEAKEFVQARLEESLEEKGKDVGASVTHLTDLQAKGKNEIHIDIKQAMAAKLGLAQTSHSYKSKMTPGALNLSRGTFIENAKELLVHKGIPVAGLSPEEIVKKTIELTSFQTLVTEQANLIVNHAQEVLNMNHLKLCGIKDLPNFRPEKAVDVTSIEIAKKLRRGEEYQRSVIKDSGEDVFVTKWGRIAEVTMEDLIDDKANLLGETLMGIAMAAVRADKKEFHDVLTGTETLSDGEAFFKTTGDDRNSFAGSSEAFDDESIGAARNGLFRQQRTTNDSQEKFEFPSKYLLVAGNLQYKTERLFGYNAMGRFQAMKEEDGVVMPFTELMPIISNWLADNQWFVFTDPRIFASIIRSTLMGKQAYSVEQEKKFSNDTICYKVSAFFGYSRVSRLGVAKGSLA